MNCRAFVFTILGIIILAFVARSGTLTDVKAGILTTAGILCFVFAFLSEFKKFKGFGLEAEMWNETQIEADNIVKQLKPLLVYTSELSVSLACRVGRYDQALTNNELHELKNILDKHLSLNLLNNTDIDRIYEPYYRLVTLQLLNVVKKPFIQKMEDLQSEIIRKLNGYPQPIRPDDETHQQLCDSRHNISSELDSIRNYTNCDLRNRGRCISGFQCLLNGLKGLSKDEIATLLSEVKDSLDDLTYFIDKKEHRRIDHWLAVKF